MAEDKFFEVEEILDSRFQERKEYLIKWKGYTSAKNTWEPEEYLEQIQGWLKDYDRAEEEKKRIEELEEAIKKLEKNETKAAVSSYESHVKRANKKLKVDVNEQKVPSLPQMGNDDQSMINDKYHFFMDPNLSSGSETSFMETGGGIECSCHTWSDQGILVSNKRSIDDGRITQFDTNLSTCQDGIAANEALKEEINRLQVEIPGKNNDIVEMDQSVNDLKNKVDRVLQEKSALEARMIAKDDAIRKLELQNGKLMMDCNELEVTRGRLLFENKLKYQKIESVNFLKIKLAKSKAANKLLQKARTQLATQNRQHKQSARASAAKTLQLETDKTELQIALDVTKEENRALVGKNSQFQKDNAELQNKLDITKEENRALVGKNSQFQKDNAELQNKLDIANPDKECLGKSAEEEKCNFYKRKIKQLYERVKEAKSEIEFCEKQKVQLREKCKKLDEKYEALLFETEFHQSKNPDHDADCNYKNRVIEMEEALEEAKRQHEQEHHLQELEIAMLHEKLKMGHYSNEVINISSDSD